MSTITAPNIVPSTFKPAVPVLPESAPFTTAQRSWLNGFFAGLLSTDGPAALSAEQGAAVLQGPAGDADDGEVRGQQFSASKVVERGHQQALS